MDDWLMSKGVDGEQGLVSLVRILGRYAFASNGVSLSRFLSNECIKFACMYAYAFVI